MGIYDCINNEIQRRQYGDAVTPDTRYEANETVDKAKRYKQILEVKKCQYTGKTVAVYAVRG